MKSKYLTRFVMPVFLCALLGVGTAHASLWQKTMSFDNDASSWDTWSTSNAGASIWKWGGVFSRSGTKSGQIWLNKKGWASLGRNISITPYRSNRPMNACVSAIYALGDKSYLEMIDTKTWTYIAPLAHYNGGGSFKRVKTAQFKPKAKKVTIRYVVTSNGGFKSVYIDDAVMQCQYD